jgi:transcriptional regulator with XRE-family HTH domain
MADMEATVEKAFGRVLQEARKRRGLSQEDLGFESGLHRTYISQLERGLKSPSLNTVYQLSKALGIAPSEILLRVESRVGASPKKESSGKRPK